LLAALPATSDAGQSESVMPRLRTDPDRTTELPPAAAAVIARVRAWASAPPAMLEADSQPRRQHKPRPDVPPGWELRTPAEAAAKLRCSLKTLKGHVAAGTLKYVAIGHGSKRPRKMFTDADLDAFIAAQTRKDVPCPSTRTRARHSSSSTSGSTVIAFTAQQRPGTDAKPKR
jgi:hypothetical protein